MKTKLRRRINRALALVLCFTFLFSTNVLAAESTDGNVSEVESLERQESELSTTSTQSAYGPGTWYLGNFSFTDTNNGAYKTINGNRMRYIVEFKPIDGELTCDLQVNCIQYGGKQVGQLHCATYDDTKQPNGYYRFETGWFNVVSGVDYRFTYWAYEIPLYSPRRVNVSIWIQVE